MRGSLRRLGPRYGVGVGLLALVAVVILAARLIPQRPPAGDLRLLPVPAAPGTSPDAVTTSAEVTDAPAGLYSPGPPQTLSGVPGPDEVALDFGRAWLAGPHETATAWVRALSVTATPELAAEFADADPTAVPASQITGAATVVGDTAMSCEVGVPTDAGILVLTLRASASRWLVAAVDWQPA